MADEAKPKRRGAGAGIGELQLLRGPRAGAPPPPGGREREGPPATQLQAPTPAAAPPLPSPASSPTDTGLLRTEVCLPEELISGARTQLRPARTGHPRTLSVPLLLQAYIRAVDALGLQIDVQGLAPGDEDEAMGRVVTALEVWKCS